MNERTTHTDPFEQTAMVSPGTRHKELGDCYEVAARIMLHSAGVEQIEEVEHTLCHGTVSGQGPVEGVRFGHAWVEWHHVPSSIRLVLDYSNGNKVVMTVAQYYALGSIDPAEVYRYTSDEALHMLLEFRHYGSWHDSK
jgi:hypothetical protein